MNTPAHRFTNEKLLEILSLSQNATAIYTGEDLIIQMANDVMTGFWGKDRSVIGKSLAEAVPELRWQPFIGLLQNVWRTGITFEAKDTAAQLLIDNKLQTFYFDFAYRAVKNDLGEVDCILHTAIDVTELNLNREVAAGARERQAALEREHDFNKELAAVNEKLIAGNEELQRTQETVKHLNEELEKRVSDRTRQLMESEQRFRSMVENSPAAMLIFRGEDLVFETVNDAMLQILGKGPEIIGKPLLEGLPEVKGQPVVDVILEVYRTGVPYTTEGIRVDLVRNGKLETGYFNGTYRPLYENGCITGIIQAAVEVTGLFKAHQAMRESEERFRNMAEGSGILIGVGDETGDVTYFNQAWATLTGKPVEELLPSGWTDLIHPDDKATYISLYMESLKNRKPYTGEYRILNASGEYRWLLAFASPRFNTDSSFAGYIGSFIDITERKQDEQRKNDFISMVSHELKTPLTSMKSYIQVLQGKARKSGDELASAMLDRSNLQVKKMTNMINGFLNVSRLEAGKIHIDLQRFDLALLVKEAEEEATATVKSHQVVFAPVVETFVNADRVKIGQVIENLINNAVKYSPTGSTIRVACVTAGNTAQASVKDEGVGIGDQDLPKLFERYYRVKDAEMRNIAGFGIGLYLCKEIIERHEGKIGVDSIPGEGSTFWFTLPVMPMTKEN